VSETLYHLELRHFPRNLCRFNLNAEELRATVLEPWVADRMFELGELRWDPRQARLTVLAGPRLALGQLTMGRGWRAAQRHGRDVTEQLLAATREAFARGVEEGTAPGVASATQADPSMVEKGATQADRLTVEGGVTGADRLTVEEGGTEVDRSTVEEGVTGADRPTVEERTGDLAADSLGLELLAQIGTDQAPLRRAWELAATRDPSGTASDALKLAERAVASLLRAGLVVLLRAQPSEASAAASEGQDGAGSNLRAVSEEDTASLLRAIESWSGDRPRAQVFMRRA
jgi:hypothetical protein